MRVSEHEACRVSAAADSAARTSSPQDANVFVLDVPSDEARDSLAERPPVVRSPRSDTARPRDSVAVDLPASLGLRSPRDGREDAR